MLWIPLILAVALLLVAILVTALVHRLAPAATLPTAVVLIGGTAAHFLVIGMAYLGVPVPAFDYRGAHLGAHYWLPPVVAVLGLLAVAGRSIARAGHRT